ncbi:MAG: nodulation protein NfeD [Spirochaetia bacterium]|nr:nodulation protein NfeD [Spirochaetia bacterium]
MNLISPGTLKTLRRLPSKVLGLLFLLGLAGILNCEKDLPKAATKKSEFAYLLQIDGAITPASLEQLDDALTMAENDQARALILNLDTPGGLATSMDSMIRRILSSPVPVLTFVGPPGASCGSAGVYILYASHLAAMAPGTNIGSATPVMIGGGETPAVKSDQIPKEAGADDQINLKRKQIHHALAQIKSLAEYHGRNSDFGQRTVSEAANVTSSEALSLGAIEMIVGTPEELLQKANGRRVRMANGYETLNLENVQIKRIETGFRARFLSLLANPALASILMMLGILGIMAEIQYPGTIFPGVIGGICLILGLYALQTLPVNYAGVGLLLLGIILMILEIKVISHGMLAVSGIICFALGAVLLVRSGGIVEKTTIALLAGTGIAIGSTIAAIIYVARKSQQSKVVSGAEQLLSEIGFVTTDVTPQGGQIRLHSEIWSARSETGTILKGQEVQVVSRSGLLLTVKPK